ncbi:MAG: ferritin-like domain-containing protein [Myxococcales bacterium]
MTYFNFESVGRVGAPYSFAQFGVRCEGAADVPACKQELQDAEAAFSQQVEPCNVSGSCGTTYIVATTKGSSVKLYTADNVAELLGTIDSPAEARLVLMMDELGSYGCGDVRQNAYKVVPEGVLLRSAAMGNMCHPLEQLEITYLVRPTGRAELVSKKVVSSDPDGCVVPGRRPPDLRSRVEPRSRDPLARFFAHAAHLEAASVPAFATIAAELEALGAPSDLVAKARRAQEDELEHARLMDAIAARFGAEPTPLEVGERPLRNAFELALDNALEGCVHETFAALLATFQSWHAEDPEIRATMARIAQDETRHAGLAWQLSEWLLPQLSYAERAQIRRAQAEAVGVLRAELEEPQASELIGVAGLPSPEQAEALVAALERGLWERSGVRFNSPRRGECAPVMAAVGT